MDNEVLLSEVSAEVKEAVINEFSAQLKRELYPNLKTAGDCLSTTVTVAEITKVAAIYISNSRSSTSKE
jgi:hypothetical protein